MEGFLDRNLATSLSTFQMMTGYPLLSYTIDDRFPVTITLLSGVGRCKCNVFSMDGAGLMI